MASRMVTVCCRETALRAIGKQKSLGFVLFSDEKLALVVYLMGNEGLGMRRTTQYIGGPLV